MPAVTKEGAWPAGYGGDGTYNIATHVYVDASGGQADGLPAAALRGGDWTQGPRAGIFALILDQSPTYGDSHIGFRCVVPR